MSDSKKNIDKLKDLGFLSEDAAQSSEDMLSRVEKEVEERANQKAQMIKNTDEHFVIDTDSVNLKWN